MEESQEFHEKCSDFNTQMANELAAWRRFKYEQVVSPHKLFNGQVVNYSGVEFSGTPLFMFRNNVTQYIFNFIDETLKSFGNSNTEILNPGLPNCLKEVSKNIKELDSEWNIEQKMEVFNGYITYRLHSHHFTH